MAAYGTWGEGGRLPSRSAAQHFPYPNFGRCAENLSMTPPLRKKPAVHTEDKVTLKTIAQHLGLTAGTVSAALNNSPAARSLPEHTKHRIIEGAQSLNY